MSAKVRLFAGLTISGTDQNETEVEAGVTIQELLERFALPRDKPQVFLINGLHATLETVLKDGDKLAIFGPVAGG